MININFYQQFEGIVNIYICKSLKDLYLYEQGDRLYGHEGITHSSSVLCLHQGGCSGSVRWVHLGLNEDNAELSTLRERICHLQHDPLYLVAWGLHLHGRLKTEDQASVSSGLTQKSHLTQTMVADGAHNAMITGSNNSVW